jgi:hypothetical protein
MRRKISWLAAAAMSITAVLTVGTPTQAGTTVAGFEPVATYFVEGGVAEIVAATPDGDLLIFTDAGGERFGFVDVSDPGAPTTDGEIDVAGEPTSVAVLNGSTALGVVAAGAGDRMVVIDLDDREVVDEVDLPGQPDSIAISPSGMFAAIAIENEEGSFPSAPPGSLAVVDLSGDPSGWVAVDVGLSGLSATAPADPEPEFVDINDDDVAAVTLQENNHVALVDLAGATDGDASDAVVGDFSAGTTTHDADKLNDRNVAFTTNSLTEEREPDAIGWTPDGNLVTANEGDNVGGSRDFTIFETDGSVVFEPGASFELAAVPAGHYPDARSAAKGSEPEGAEIGTFGDRTFAFIGSERGSFVGVYDLEDEADPELVQILPTGVSPEGLLAIPAADLFVSANEVEGSISIFRGVSGGVATYSAVDVASDGAWWSALSGMAPAPGGGLYAVGDSALAPARFFTVDPGTTPATVTSSTPIAPVSLGGAAQVIDPEGVAVDRRTGDLWIASEGATNASGVITRENLLVRVSPAGAVRQVVTLPAAIRAQQRNFGFEGVATSANGKTLFVAFQRPWIGDAADITRIGVYNTQNGIWKFFRYRLDEAASPTASRWVGLSEITALDADTFAIVERDNALGSEAVVKRIYTVELDPEVATKDATKAPIVPKTLVRDVIDADGVLLEKIEGLGIAGDGQIYAVYDNDGAGTTTFLRWGSSFA